MKKSNLKTKLQFYLGNNQPFLGFTLLELMVVMIFLSLLAAVALPNLVRQAGKAREVEFKNVIGVTNRAQQAYHWERGIFAQGANDPESISLLNLGFDTAYIDDYNIIAYTDHATIAPTNTEFILDQTRAYSGGAYYDPSTGLYSVILCQSDTLAEGMAEPVNDGDCGPDAVRIK